VPATQATGQLKGTFPTRPEALTSQPGSPAPILTAAQAEPPAEPSQMLDRAGSTGVA
jgi:hypothetical protein